jgi:uncharacterized protein
MTGWGHGECVGVLFLYMLTSWLSLASIAWSGDNKCEAAYFRDDYATAYPECLPLAIQGDASAQSLLGSMYEEGQGTSRDYGQAVWWYHKAAEQGHQAAQIFLARMYEYGRGVPQDFGQAVEWYRKAAEQAPIGGPQCSLGRMYMLGHGVPRDYVQAYLWFNFAAFQFLPGKYQEAAAQARDLVAARMTPAQVAEAQRLAREWKPKRP